MYNNKCNEIWYDEQHPCDVMQSINLIETISACQDYSQDLRTHTYEPIITCDICLSIGCI